MRFKTMAAALFAGFLALGPTGCASNQAQIPVQAMPAGATFSGHWYTNFDDMKLTQQPDGQTRGTFEYKTGGEVEGKVEGGVFVFQWVQHGDFQVGRREVRGKGYLVMGADGLSIEGEWGYGENYTGGGIWNGTKATEMYR